MRIGGNIAGTDYSVENGTARGKRFTGAGYGDAVSFGNSVVWTAGSHLPEPGSGGVPDGTEAGAPDGGETGRADAPRSEAELIYQAVTAGKPNPIGSLRDVPKVPYGNLAKDGVIEYNGVVFVCDGQSNSICLGDMSDPKKVLNITLSGGGHLKVNRDSIGLLSRAAGMFSPEDLNLIMRAIAEDAKIQSVKKEIEDEEASVGNRLRGDGETAEEEEAASE